MGCGTEQNILRIRNVNGWEMALKAFTILSQSSAPPVSYSPASFCSYTYLSCVCTCVTAEDTCRSQFSPPAIVGAGDWTQVVRQVPSPTESPHHYSLNPLLLLYFKTVSLSYLGMSWTCHPPSSAIFVTGIITKPNLIWFVNNTNKLWPENLH